jgi:hypothetical protein
MEIKLPAEGVYGVVDHSKNPVGFKTIKLKLKNITMNGTVSENMTGEFVVVAKYHRNGCYKPDLSGQFLQDKNGNWDGNIPCPKYRTNDEEISVSAPLSLSSLVYGVAQDVEATFTNPIPIEATDLYLQVVFKGKLGDEEGAVAVVTKDIAEPNFYTFVNNSDQLCVNGNWVNTFDQNAVKAAITALGLTPGGFGEFPTPVDIYFGFQNNGTYSNWIANIPAGGYSRMAVLTDSGVTWPIDIIMTGSPDPVTGQKIWYEFTLVKNNQPVFNQNITTNGPFGFTPVWQFRTATNGFKLNTGILPQVYIAKTCDISGLAATTQSAPTSIKVLQPPFGQP